MDETLISFIDLTIVQIRDLYGFNGRFGPAYKYDYDKSVAPPFNSISADGIFIIIGFW